MNVTRTSSLPILADLAKICKDIDCDMTPETNGFMIHSRCHDTITDLRKLLRDAAHGNDAVCYLIGHATVLPFELGLYITNV